MITREQALKILNKNIKNKNLIRHCLAVEAAMKSLAKYFNNKSASAKASADKWALVGLLHDGDWEETNSNPKLHTVKMIEWLKETGEKDEEVLQAMRSHNFVHTGADKPNNLMEWSLYCCDELTGLIVAAALVLPDKRINSLTVQSVLKRFREKKFAAGARRDQIAACEEKLKIKLEKFIDIVLKSIQEVSIQLGL